MFSLVFNNGSLVVQAQKECFVFLLGVPIFPYSRGYIGPRIWTKKLTFSKYFV